MKKPPRLSRPETQKTLDNLWGTAKKYNDHELQQNSKRSTVTPVGCRGNKPIGKR